MKCGISPILKQRDQLTPRGWLNFQLGCQMSLGKVGPSSILLLPLWWPPMEIYLSNCLVHVGQGNQICLGIIWCFKSPGYLFRKKEKMHSPKGLMVGSCCIIYSRKFVYPFLFILVMLNDPLSCLSFSGTKMKGTETYKIQ